MDRPWIELIIARSATTKRLTLLRSPLFFLFSTSGRCTCNEDRNPTRKRNKHSVTGKDAPSNPLKLIGPRFPVAGKGAASSNRECHLHTKLITNESSSSFAFVRCVWNLCVSIRFHPIQIAFDRFHAQFPLLNNLLPTPGFTIAYWKLFGIGRCKNIYICIYYRVMTLCIFFNFVFISEISILCLSLFFDIIRLFYHF